MTKTTILLDVDGVLNDWSAHPTRDFDTGLAMTEYDAPSGYRIFYAKEILERLQDLHARDDVEVKWLTTWCHRANSELRTEFGFADDLEVIGDAHHKDRNLRGWWKLHAARDYIAQNPDERIVWIDDDLAHATEALLFAYEHDNIYALAPSPCLSHHDLDRIESWIDNE